MAGAAGGMKEVPEEVATHPMVFLTLTAPSFGAVHSIAVDRRTGECAHGMPRGCRCDHSADDSQRGDAVCPDCYDYVGHVVWQFHAPELWRRFTISLRRELARALGLTQRQASRIVRVQFAKVAEFQRCGVVHFHAIIRLDGVDPVDPFPAPPVFVTTAQLVAAITAAVRKTRVVAAPYDRNSVARELRWGKQFDARPIIRQDGLDGSLSDRAVAAYIAKYATKATEDLEPKGEGRDHIKRIKSTVVELARTVDAEGPYAQLRRWDGMLGFRGHFSTKSRRYSVTPYAKDAELAAGLTNVATIGGIVSGLSLSGTAVLSLSGRYTVRILERYGSAIRFVLFGGFAVLVTASLLCAVSVMWADEIWPRYVLAFTVPLMLITLLATAMLINSAFAREREGNNMKELVPSPCK